MLIPRSLHDPTLPRPLLLEGYEKMRKNEPVSLKTDIAEFEKGLSEIEGTQNERRIDR